MSQPKWRKSPSKLVELFDGLCDQLPPEVQRRKMFGYPCCFFQGQMFVGLHQENMVLRLSEDDRREFLSIAGAAQFEPMPGRVMKEYIVVPKSLLSQPSELRGWMARSLGFVRSLGPKPTKAGRRKSHQ